MKYSIIDEKGERPSSKREISAIIRDRNPNPPIDLRLLDTADMGATLTLSGSTMVLGTRWYP